LVDLTKSTLINFSYNFKISANLFQHLWHKINFKRKYIINSFYINILYCIIIVFLFIIW
jgi:hypothetical protein